MNTANCTSKSEPFLKKWFNSKVKLLMEEYTQLVSSTSHQVNRLQKIQQELYTLWSNTASNYSLTSDLSSARPLALDFIRLESRRKAADYLSTELKVRALSVKSQLDRSMWGGDEYLKLNQEERRNWHAKQNRQQKRFPSLPSKWPSGENLMPLYSILSQLGEAKKPTLDLKKRANEALKKIAEMKELSHLYKAIQEALTKSN